MSTQAQIDANRANAAKSTGPQSAEGKARSAMNAFKSGLEAQSLIIPGESPDAFAQLRDEYYTRFTATDPEQRFHLDTAIRHDWLLRRFERVEEQLWALAATRIEKPIANLELGQSFDKESPVIMRLHRRVAHSEKTYKEAMATFHSLQSATNPQPNPEPPQPKPQPLPKLASFPIDTACGPHDPFLAAMEAHVRQMYEAEGLDYDAFRAAYPTPGSDSEEENAQ